MNQHQQPLDAQVAPMNAIVLGGGGPAGAVVGAWLTIQPDGLSSVVGLMRDRAAWHAANAGSGRGGMRLLRRMAEGPARRPDPAIPALSQACTLMHTCGVPLNSCSLTEFPNRSRPYAGLVACLAARPSLSRWTRWRCPAAHTSCFIPRPFSPTRPARGAPDCSQ
jgi:hypothetical protein